MSPRAGRISPDTTFDRRQHAAGSPADRARPSGRRASDKPSAEAARATVVADAKPARKRRATRDGREPLVVYMPPESIKALKFAALEYDTTASAIVLDAVMRWLDGTLPRRK